MSDPHQPLWAQGYHARNLAALVGECMINPAAPFIVGDDGRRFTYARFWTLAAKLAHALQAAGAKPGDRVAAQVEKSVEAVALFWACARAGRIFVPLNTAYTTAEGEYFLRDAQPLITVCVPERLPDMYRISEAAGVRATFTLDDRGHGTLADEAMYQDAMLRDELLHWDDPAAILYTSGTTGKAKGAVLTHGNLASNALTLAGQWEFSPADRLIHALPTYHTHGLFTAVATILLTGGCLLFRRKFDADDVVKLLPEATSLMGVPTFYTRLLAHAGLTREAAAHMRLFISGSAPLLAETHRQFRMKTGQAILERYGMTETGMNSSNPVAGMRRAGTVGLPLMDVEVRITDRETGELLPKGQDGLIEVRGPNVFAGYWRNDQKTQEAFRDDGFFITGDIGRIEADNYLVISGRANDLIISGGFNVYPREVELVLDTLPGVLESAVIGVPHADLGEGVVAVVVMKEGAAFSPEALSAHLGERLARFKQPRAWVQAGELPRNAMGKVQKAVLRAAHRDILTGVKVGA